ncbi:gibberellin 2-beta-dioxygenase 8-like [Cucumis melo var. makuwa]|uniref:Gibberellin 2-beta-dioxygenase 8-like n=1 Tax=Cucumis melo var. makuwa TaxID=1194695 RepID=A0A5D3BIM3_CUCMM|nr:gibberellin 2-beta-dioxygenase 8-like [Cucumis melo var. makuwa]
MVSMTRHGHFLSVANLPLLLPLPLPEKLNMKEVKKKLGGSNGSVGGEKLASGSVEEEGGSSGQVTARKSTALDLMRLMENISDRDGLRRSARSTGGKITRGARVCGDLRRGWGGAPTTADGRLDVMVD